MYIYICIYYIIYILYIYIHIPRAAAQSCKHIASCTCVAVIYFKNALQQRTATHCNAFARLCSPNSIEYPIKMEKYKINLYQKMPEYKKKCTKK